jgi:hypothetical protein
MLLTPWTRALFDAQPLTFHQWVLTLGLGILPFLIMEGEKTLRQVWGKSQASPEQVSGKSGTCLRKV